MGENMRFFGYTGLLFALMILFCFALTCGAEASQYKVRMLTQQFMSETPQTNHQDPVVNPVGPVEVGEVPGRDDQHSELSRIAFTTLPVQLSVSLRAKPLSADHWTITGAQPDGQAVDTARLSPFFGRGFFTDRLVMAFLVAASAEQTLRVDKLGMTIGVAAPTLVASHTLNNPDGSFTRVFYDPFTRQYSELTASFADGKWAFKANAKEGGVVSVAEVLKVYDDIADKFGYDLQQWKKFVDAQMLNKILEGASYYWTRVAENEVGLRLVTTLNAGRTGDAGRREVQHYGFSSRDMKAFNVTAVESGTDGWTIEKANYLGSGNQSIGTDVLNREFKFVLKELEKCAGQKMFLNFLDGTTMAPDIISESETNAGNLKGAATFDTRPTLISEFSVNCSNGDIVRLGYDPTRHHVFAIRATQSENKWTFAGHYIDGGDIPVENIASAFARISTLKQGAVSSSVVERFMSGVSVIVSLEPGSASATPRGDFTCVVASDAH
jgi:hypothetical protein